eukprot:TRINITY_DN7220_c0_g1_i1.p1 TRINITY_DN7220_c0_g1~~TRINITY_DN7220_c0_g1_i1.p1  ORF type:complete len:1162 (-),score=233.11 TRINITY_DN7220_c0_g1_i1:91-3576(-)
MCAGNTFNKCLRAVRVVPSHHYYFGSMSVSCEELVSWLRSRPDYQRYAAKFESEEIGGKALLELSESELKELGLTTGARKTIKNDFRKFFRIEEQSRQEQFALFHQNDPAAPTTSSSLGNKIPLSQCTPTMICGIYGRPPVQTLNLLDITFSEGRERRKVIAFSSASDLEANGIYVVNFEEKPFEEKSHSEPTEQRPVPILKADISRALHLCLNFAKLSKIEGDGEQKPLPTILGVDHTLSFHNFAEVVASSTQCPVQYGIAFTSKITVSANSKLAQDKEIFVVFRSTTTFEDMKTDLSAWPAFFGDYPGKCHAGFLALASHVPLDKFANYVHDGYRIVFCGHSLGGAVAHLVALRLLIHSAIAGTAQHLVVSIAFGSPYSVDAEAAKLIEKKYPQNFLSIVREKDPIPTALDFTALLQSDIVKHIETGVEMGAKAVASSATVEFAKTIWGWLKSASSASTNYSPFGRYWILRENSVDETSTAAKTLSRLRGRKANFADITQHPLLSYVMTVKPLCEVKFATSVQVVDEAATMPSGSVGLNNSIPRSVVQCVKFNPTITAGTCVFSPASSMQRQYSVQITLEGSNLDFLLPETLSLSDAFPLQSRPKVLLSLPSQLQLSVVVKQVGANASFSEAKVTVDVNLQMAGHFASVSYAPKFVGAPAVTQAQLAVDGTKPELLVRALQIGFHQLAHAERRANHTTLELLTKERAPLLCTLFELENLLLKTTAFRNLIEEHWKAPDQNSAAESVHLLYGRGFEIATEVIAKLAGPLQVIYERTWSESIGAVALRVAAAAGVVAAVAVTGGSALVYYGMIAAPAWAATMTTTAAAGFAAAGAASAVAFEAARKQLEESGAIIQKNYQAVLQLLLDAIPMPPECTETGLRSSELPSEAGGVYRLEEAIAKKVGLLGWEQGKILGWQDMYSSKGVFPPSSLNVDKAEPSSRKLVVTRIGACVLMHQIRHSLKNAGMVGLTGPQSVGKSTLRQKFLHSCGLSTSEKDIGLWNHTTSPLFFPLIDTRVSLVDFPGMTATDVDVRTIVQKCGQMLSLVLYLTKFSGDCDSVDQESIRLLRTHARVLVCINQCARWKKELQSAEKSAAKTRKNYADATGLPDSEDYIMLTDMTDHDAELEALGVRDFTTLRARVSKILRELDLPELPNAIYPRL